MGIVFGFTLIFLMLELWILFNYDYVYQFHADTFDINNENVSAQQRRQYTKKYGLFVLIGFLYWIYAVGLLFSSFWYIGLAILCLSFIKIYLIKFKVKYFVVPAGSKYTLNRWASWFDGYLCFCLMFFIIYKNLA